MEDLEELTALDIAQEAEVSRVTRTNEVAVMVEMAMLHGRMFSIRYSKPSTWPLAPHSVTISKR